MGCRGDVGVNKMIGLVTVYYKSNVLCRLKVVVETIVVIVSI